MRLVEVRRTDQVYTHVDDSDGTTLTINASAVERWAKATNQETYLIDVDDKVAAVIAKNSCVNPDHLRSLSDERLKEPLVMIHWGDGTQILIDGNHRYVRASQLKRLFIETYLIDRADWLPFEITDMPADLKAFVVQDVRDSRNANANREA